MFNNVFLNYALRYVPQENWNDLSSFCACFSLPTIGSPIRFSHYNKFTLREYVTMELPASLADQFLLFCYPADLPDRQQQIDYDRNLYWQNAVTFLVFNDNQEIVGCVQIVHRNDYAKLPVEYASVINSDGSKEPFNLQHLITGNDINEIYRCRRSFNLNKIEAINVLLMLFKAIWIHIVRTRSTYTCISFDVTKPELQHLYINKLAFYNPGIKLVFGDTPQQWCLLIKDWAQHEKTYASLGKTQFFIQTWCRRSFKRKQLKVAQNGPGNVHKAHIAAPDNVLITRTIKAPQSARPRKRTQGIDPIRHRK